MNKKLLLSTILAISLNATNITGIGYADLEVEAKKEALFDLSNKISVEVKSNFKTVTKTMGDEYSKSKDKIVELSSNLPILGATFDKLVGDSLVKSTATLSSENVFKLYLDELQRLHKNISHSELELSTTKSDDLNYTILNQLLSDIESFNKHKIVATLLKENDTIYLPKLNITKNEVLINLTKYIKSSPSIAIATKVLSHDINQKDIYISAITTSNSQEITQFAKIVKDQLSKNISTVRYSKDASYFLRGSYEILKNSIFITYKLHNINNNIIKTNTATLNPSAYKDIRYKPSTKTFDSAINSEFIKAGTVM